MKTLIKKTNTFLIILLAAAMAFSSAFSAAFAGEGKSEEAQYSYETQLVSNVSLARIAIVQNPVMTQTEVTTRQQIGPESCVLSAQISLLQGSVNHGLFTNPASCFSLKFGERQVSPQPLQVFARPSSVPQVVFYDLSQRIRNELSAPFYPDQDQSGTLPTIFAAGLLVALVSFRRENKAIKMVEPKFLTRILSPESLQVMRC